MRGDNRVPNVDAGEAKENTKCPTKFGHKRLPGIYQLFSFHLNVNVILSYPVISNNILTTGDVVRDNRTMTLKRSNLGIADQPILPIPARLPATTLPCQLLYIGVYKLLVGNL